MAATITHREYKLLLQADRFRLKKQVIEFNDLLATLAKRFGVRYDEFEAIDSQIRQVQFFDTPEQDFRNNRVILRLRQDQTSGWPDETWEVTFKRRTPDYQEAIDFNVGSTTTLHEKRKFKEELVRGPELGTIRRIFSNNNVAQSPIKSFTAPMSRLIDIFPSLKALNVDGAKTVAAVNHAEGLRDRGETGEPRVRQGCRRTGRARGVDAPDDRCLQRAGRRVRLLVSRPRLRRQNIKKPTKRPTRSSRDPGAAQDWLFEGSTKTALIYGVNE